ncbi:MAG: AAA family ATPase [Bacillus thermozeamaize]|jgi:putative ATPase|uniref:Replication-associated recombination protein A n=1 Tax=Bacillus thermozeamaize TaxID=230954 RepID=A0A1Y3PM85_9BACI|nr:MAG: AAA family ATPase [Bacillus thermozeamaize]
MDLFAYDEEKMAPLAARMRPRHLDEMLGQQHLIGKGKLLRRVIESDRLTSAIFWGPPGCGKTTLARVIAETTSAHFVTMNAVSATVKELRQVIDEAEELRRLYGRKTILFLDEIHRFNKAQQDALLPAVEKGVLILIGATTENPYFEVNSALLSRSQLFPFYPLSEADIKEAVRRALADGERGLGRLAIRLDEEALDYIASRSNGDVRVALNTLELAALSTEEDETGVRHITLAVAEECLQQPALRYDRGDHRYDMMSALIKSIRGSDSQAALYWLACMLEGGEDPKVIARRLLVHASEDIGLANPQALVQAAATWTAVQAVGMPEARINLAQCVIYLAESPKSNSVIRAIDAAMNDVRSRPTGEVPLHLRDTHYAGAKKLGHGKGYKYPHDYPGHWVAQQYLPDELVGRRYYEPTRQGQEASIWKKYQERFNQ